ncbi:YkgJ family cysteine cluster protein [Candidatus Omnitrophota bacterium]
MHEKRRHAVALCKTCKSGSCCKDGVEVDFKKAIELSLLDLNLKKPWFEGLCRDNDFPSGWRVATIVRDRRCVFQRKNKLCRIYPVRPLHCADFPIENGKIPSLYKYLCSESRKNKKCRSVKKR